MNARPAEQASIPTARLVKAALVLVVLLQLPLVFHRAVNWDEFWHYSLTVLAANGTLDQPLQTFFTRPFAWVPGLPVNAIDHVIIIRLFMAACEWATLAAIVGIATRFADRTTGYLCALAYLSAAYVMQHGTSYRYDPPVTALLMGCLWVFACRPLIGRWIALAGVLGGLAAMVTIKSVLYAPAFAGLVWLRWQECEDRRGFIASLVKVAAVAAATLAGAYFLHSLGIVETFGRSSKEVLGASADRMFSLTYHPYVLHNIKGAALSPIVTILVLLAPVFLITSKRPVAERIALAGFWLPLTTLAFYHNTAPYYHVFMLAPVAVSLAAVIPAAVRRYDARVLAAVFVLSAIAVLALEKPSPINKQRQLVDAASRIFGGPVAYFDSCAMIGQFRKVNAFMTPWGTQRYLTGQLPSMLETMRTETVPLVVNDDVMFNDALETQGDVSEFLPADLAMLRSTYLHFWGPFWVAGFDLPSGAAGREIDVRVPGPYTVTGLAAATVDGVEHKPGEVFVLDRGRHVVGAQPVKLVWGRNLKVPAQEAPAEPHFTSF